MRNSFMPKRIYLQICDENGELLDYHDRTWCLERINDTDIEYILNIENLVNAEVTLAELIRSENYGEAAAILRQAIATYDGPALPLAPDTEEQ